MHQAATLSALIGFLLFCNSLDLHFCLDDDAAITGNPDLLGNASWLNLLKNDFWGKLISDRESHKSYRPLTVATFRLNYMLHELRPLGYHLVNVLLHSAVCYLYVLLCGVILSEVWPSLIAGLLFAVHPIHTEAVSQKKDINACMQIIFMHTGIWVGWSGRYNECYIHICCSSLLPKVAGSKTEWFVPLSSVLVSLSTSIECIPPLPLYASP